MACRLIQIPFSEVPSFSLTLTYHNGFSVEPKRWHAQLHSWEVKLSRDWAQFGPSLLWMLEFQERGAPHFHAILCWEREPVLEQFRRWLSTTWNAIAEPGDELHRQAGTRADRIDTRSPIGTKKLLLYLMKHAIKPKQKHRRDSSSGEELLTGKMWDVFGDLPQVVLDVLELGEEALTQLYRRLRRWGKKSRFLKQMGKLHPGGVIISGNAEVAQLLRGLPQPTGLPP